MLSLGYNDFKPNFTTYNNFVNRDLTVNEPLRYPHQKRKKPSLSSSLPCRVRYAREQGSAVSLAANCSPCEPTGFPSDDFTDSLSRASQRTGRKGMTMLESKDDVPRYGFSMDLEQNL